MPIPFILAGIAAGTAITGIGAGVKGAKKIKEASEIVDSANYRFNKKKREVEDKDKTTNYLLDQFGKLKLDIWSKDFKSFIDTFEQIHNKPNMKDDISNDKVFISSEELKSINDVSLNAIQVLSGITGSVAAGAFAGIGALGGATLFGAASTGTAISALSGAAATNATLAFFGGGSLAAGGLGMAGGTMVLSGLVAGPALAVGGLLLNSKGTQSLEKARAVDAEADKAIKKMDAAITLLNKLSNFTREINSEVKKVRSDFIKELEPFKATASKKKDYEQFTYEEKKNLERTILYLKVLKVMLNINMIKETGYSTIFNTYAKTDLDKALKEHKRIKDDQKAS